MIEKIDRISFATHSLPALLVALATALMPAHAADTDGDGIDDAVDNCTEVVNPGQRDTDIDGYGNFCDPDVNNDLVVNFADLDEFRTAFFSSAEETDLDGDGSTNFADLQIVKQYFFGPPGPGAPDVDGDGVPLSQDRCDESPPGATALDAGCSAFEINEDPDAFVGEINTMLDDLLAKITDDPDIGFIADNLVSAQLQLGNGVDTIRRGQMCNGAVMFFGGITALSNAHVQLTETIVATEEELSINRPFTNRDCISANPPPLCDEGADHTEEDSVLASFLVAGVELEQLHEAAQYTAVLFENACGDSDENATAEGTIIEMEPDRSRLFLDDGTYVGVADGNDLPPDIYPGRQVFIAGTGYGGNSILAEAVSAFGPESPLADFLNYETCVELKFAPWQRFGPVGSPPYILHDPEGYRDSSNFYRVEHGMRLGAEDIPFCGDSFGPFIVRYSLNLTLQFVNRNNDQTETWVLATEFDETDEPVALPSLVKPLTDATLFVTRVRQSCEVINLRDNDRAPGNSIIVCSEQDEYANEQLTLRFLDKGGYCNASYDREQFSLEEVSQTTFQPTFVDGKQTIFVVADPGTTPMVVGDGYEVTGASTSTYPSLQRIDEGEQFAMFEHDCVTDTGLYVEEICGTLSASGLRYPRLEGTRNALPFRYSCRVPFVVRDLMDECNPPPDSFYKLPFFGGFPDWTISQGNNGTFTHTGSQAYAFDFVNDAGTTVRAARGGTVTWVREDQTGNSYYNPQCSDCSANAVQVTHQDGTVSQYFHFQTNGVFVTQGQKVKRGDPLGSVGNTGYSTGPHVHFHARFPASDTFPVRFRSVDNGMTVPPFACYIPQSGDFLFSDNN